MEISLPLIIQLSCGAIGGNLAGSIMKKLSLGTFGNSVVGILGGGIGGQLLAMLGVSVGRSGTDIDSIIGSVLNGTVGGCVFIIIIGMLKKVFSK